LLQDTVGGGGRKFKRGCENATVCKGQEKKNLEPRGGVEPGRGATNGGGVKEGKKRFST